MDPAFEADEAKEADETTELEEEAKEQEEAGYEIPEPTDPKSSEEIMIAKLDNASFKLKQQGQYMESLECMERALVLRQHVHTSNSEQVWAACTELAEM